MANKSEKGNEAAPAEGLPADYDEFDGDVTVEVTAADVHAGRTRTRVAPTRSQAAATEPSASRRPPTDVLTSGFIFEDRYRIVELVHSGGMARVYKAVDGRSAQVGSAARYVAVKVLRQDLADRVDLRAAMHREASRARRLTHPNIVEVLDFGEQDGRFFIVMEWLGGESLQHLLLRTAGRPLDGEFAWRVIRALAAALRHAHANDVVHADIHPSNVLLTDTQKIKLLDFGVARASGDGDDARNDATVWATRSYASPQVLAGSRPVFQDDIFSLGCVAYRLLSGVHPFGGVTSMDAEQAGVAPSAIAGLAATDWDVVRGALSFSRSERPETAAAFLQTVTAGAAAGAERRVPAPSGYRPALATAVAVALVVFGWWLWPTGAPDRPAPAAAPEPDSVPATAAEGPAASEAEGAAEELLAGEAETSADEQAGSEAVTAQVTEEGTATDAAPVDEPAVAQAATPAGVVDEPAEAAGAAPVAAPSEASRLARLLAGAERAIAAERLVAPDGDNARALYRQALTLEPGNPAALAGLRAISDAYAELGQAAVQAESPERALEALAIATATDSGNPALGDLDAMLRTVADGYLDDALAAIAGGDVVRASQLLREAERYAGIDPVRARALSARIAGEQRFRDGLSTADEHIAAGRLILPGGDNAHAVLLELLPEHGGDPRLVASVERLAERLLLQASAAIGDGRLSEADKLLDAAGALGVLKAELATVRASLERAGADDPPGPVATAGSPAVARSRADTVPTIDARGGSADVLSTPVDGGAAEPGSAGAGTPDRTVPGDSGAKVTAQPDKTEYQSLSDLGIERYVPPRFPRVARYRDQTGFVDLRFRIRPDGSTADIEVVSAEPGDTFVSSAETAVSRWRFTRRDDAIAARVRLSFELEP